MASVRTLLAFAAVIASVTAAAQNSPSVGQSAPSISTVDVLCGRDEATCLSRLASTASRDGDHLRLRLANGKAKTFTTTRQACEANIYEKCLIYSLMGYYAGHRHFLVGVHFLFHGGVYLLVSGRTGSHIKLDQIPHYSPTGKRLAAVSASESEDHGDNSIEIWSTSGDTPRSEWRYTVPVGQYALYEFVGWDGDERLKMTVTTRIGEKLHKSVPVEAVRTRDGWRLMPPVLK